MNGGYNPATASSVEGDEDWPLDANGRTTLYHPFWHKVHQLAQIGLAAGNVAAGFNPIANAITAFSGQNPDGSCASKFDRLMAAFGVVDAVGDLGEIGEAEATVARLCRGEGQCFVAGTPVQMADGTTKPIEQIKKGDLVLSRDPNEGADGKVVAARVLGTFVHSCPIEQIVTVTLSSGGQSGHNGQSERIACTDKHPFFVRGKGWVRAGQLAVGDKLDAREGVVTGQTGQGGQGGASAIPATSAGSGAANVTVIGVEHHNAKADGKRISKATPATTTVYNFEVAWTHTYFVGKTGGGEWVHNAPDCLTIRQTKTLKLSDPSWREADFKYQLVYLLRDADTGERLKVGCTHGGTFRGRFKEYITAGNKFGRRLELDVIEFTGMRTRAFEDSLRQWFEDAGEALPWDNTDERLGRSGSGIPQ